MYKSTDKVFIVATGWSLIGFDFDRLKGKNVIAINGAAAYVDFDYAVCIDIELVTTRPHLEFIKDALTGKKVITHHEPNIAVPYDTIVMQYGGVEGFDFEHNKVRTAGNSGYMAINAAYHLGAREIYLLGYDLKRGPMNSRYFYEWADPKTTHTDYMNSIYFYESMARDLVGSDVNIYNCSKDSALEVFKKIDYRFERKHQST